MPAFTTRQELAAQVLGQLRIIDNVENQLRFEMAFLGKKGKDAAVADATRGIEEGDTYNDALRRCEERRDRFREAYADVMPLVEKMHARQEAEQEVALAEREEAEAAADSSQS